MPITIGFLHPSCMAWVLGWNPDNVEVLCQWGEYEVTLSQVAAHRKTNTKICPSSCNSMLTRLVVGVGVRVWVWSGGNLSGFALALVRTEDRNNEFISSIGGRPAIANAFRLTNETQAIVLLLSVTVTCLRFFGTFSLFSQSFTLIAPIIYLDAFIELCGMAHSLLLMHGHEILFSL